MQKIYLESCESTNDVAMNLAREGCEHGTAVIAKEQTRGKGRLGRAWESFEGNLAMSIVVRPKLDLNLAYRLVGLSAYATVYALENRGVQAYIKWPNDILIAPPGARSVEKLGPFRKVGGILLEMLGSNGRLEAAVIGIGLNLRTPPENQRHLILPQMGFVDIEVESFTSELLSSLEFYLPLAQDQKEYLSVLAKISSRSAFLGREVKVDSGLRTVKGVVKDLLPDGGLLLSTTDGEESIYVGDVSLTDA